MSNNSFVTVTSFLVCKYCQDQYSACELSQSCSDYMDIADRLAADAGGVAEDSEAQAQLGELSHQLLSASYSSGSGSLAEVVFVRV